MRMHEVMDSKLEDAKKLAANPEVQASAILAVGPALWRWINHLSNVDFVLSFTGERFRVILTFLDDWGWLLATLLGLFIIYMHWRDRKKPATQVHSPSWLMVIAISFVAFLFGITTTIQITGSVPAVTLAWGSAPGNCSSVIDGAKMIYFKKDYQVAMACGIFNPSIDKLQDVNITLSNTFEIVPNQIPIVAEYSSKTNHYLNLLDEAHQHHPFQIQVWHLALLVPDNIVLRHMGTLAEFRKAGGKIVAADYN
jgi:hypothetical protein